MGTNVDTGNSN